MAKHKKNILSSKWIKWGIVPLILLSFWLVMSLLYFKHPFGFTSLINNYSADDFTKYSTEELLQGDTVHGRFKAKHNYLGIVLVRFNTFYKINNDFVIFRIKEGGQNKWFYENRYKVDQFQPNKLFTFGFPVISDSEGKTYVFEIESVQGIEDDAVAISDIEPVFVAMYQFPKSEITSSAQKAITFAALKTVNSFSNIDFVVTSLVYLLPLLIYVFHHLFFTKYFSDKYYFALIPVIILFVQSFFVDNANDLVIIILVISVALTMYIYKLESSITFAFALVFLIFTPTLLIAGQKRVAENFAMWTYMLLVIGTIQAVRELKTKNKKMLGLAEFVRRLSIRKKSPRKHL